MTEMVNGEPSPRSSLQQQAIQDCQAAYSRLPQGDAQFRQCVVGKETLADVLAFVEQKGESQGRKRPARFMRGLEKYSTWLQNLSAIVDVAVQTQAGIACPIWAPIKFILQASNDYAKSTNMIMDLLQAITDALPRLELYERLQSSDALQIALLHVFTDIVDFCLCAYRYLRRGTIVRLTKIMLRSFDQDAKALISRLDHHARTADQTALAVELLRATEYRNECERVRQEEQRLECISWLKPANMREVRQHQLNLRLEGTCQWIRDEPGYTSWCNLAFDADANSRILLCSGKSGSGKSVLAASIVENLEKDGLLVLFFSFSNSNSSRQRCDDLLRTLLSQLIQKVGTVRILEIVQKLRQRGHPSTQDLLETFGEANALSKSSVFAVVDGIDECSNSEESGLLSVIQLLNHTQSLHLLLSGRPHVMERLLRHSKLQPVYMHGHGTAQDLDKYISSRLANSPTLSQSDIQSDISMHIKRNSDGMFLWVRLIIEDLEKSSTRFELKQRLKQMPLGLEDVYRLIFNRLLRDLDQNELQVVINLLAFAITSYRPLSFEEFRHAYALQQTREKDSSSDHEDHLIWQSCQRVVGMCGGLIITAGDKLHLVHCSVRDFLTRPATAWETASDQALKIFEVNLSQTHCTMALVCFAFIERYSRADVQNHGVVQRITPKTDQPLLEYATIFIFYHLNRAKPDCPRVQENLLKLFNSPECLGWVERFWYFLIKDISLESQAPELETFLDSMPEDTLRSAFVSGLEKLLRQREDRSQSSSLTEDLKTLILKNTIEQMRDRQCEEDEDEDEGIADCVGDSPESKTERLAPDQHDKLVKGIAALPKDVSGERTKASAMLAYTTRLIKDRKISSMPFQLEICLGLQVTIRQFKVLTDPLKLLFRLIMDKSATLPVYALLSVASFYRRIDKLQECTGVLQAALEKVQREEIPLKYKIQGDLAECCWAQSMFSEALKNYKVTLDGQRALFGGRHKDTLNTLSDLIELHITANEVDEARELCDVLFNGRDHIPEHGLGFNLSEQRRRYDLFHDVRDPVRVSDLKEIALSTLDRYVKERSGRKGKTSKQSWSTLMEIACTHRLLHDHDKAVQAYQNCIGLLQSKKPPKDLRERKKTLLSLQRELAVCYSGLGRSAEARKLCETTLEEQKRILPANHIDIWWTYDTLDLIESTEEIRRENQFPEPFDLDFRRNSCDSFDEFDNWELERERVVTRRYSTSF